MIANQYDFAKEAANSIYAVSADEAEADLKKAETRIGELEEELRKLKAAN